ncbi:MAG: hypothetical protein DA330_06045 [Nitrososphaera sp.]|nr:hypothetical protein [Nitrososphaera sp.]
MAAMFRDIPSDNIRKRLACKVCGIVQDVPMHHNKVMIWSLAGSFRKTEYLKCQVCGQTMEMPKHCNAAMFYSEYLDAPESTKKEE